MTRSHLHFPKGKKSIRSDISHSLCSKNVNYLDKAAIGVPIYIDELLGSHEPSPVLGVDPT